ncbi:MAG: hypothetical protein C5B50_22235 [Verrucomicrobia bacterium]|nr:MAG: hypothetical protein C5B50_22235 [Verrucomicrobiota bacterium]
MSEPIRIKCSDLSKVPANEELKTMVDAEHHVVLEFPARAKVDKRALISRIALALPDCSIFDSGGRGDTEWITVKWVIPQAIVLAHAREIGQAIGSYVQACSALLTQYTEGTLSSDWSSDIHGEHCRFENSETKQIVEAPLAGPPRPDKVDPYFFSIFVKSTRGLEPVARLIRDDFHDALRIFDVLSEAVRQGLTRLDRN